LSLALSERALHWLRRADAIQAFCRARQGPAGIQPCVRAL